jgi:hypothetical protein
MLAVISNYVKGFVKLFDRCKTRLPIGLDRIAEADASCCFLSLGDSVSEELLEVPQEIAAFPAAGLLPSTPSRPPL